MKKLIVAALVVSFSTAASAQLSYQEIGHRQRVCKMSGTFAEQAYWAKAANHSMPEMPDVGPSKHMVPLIRYAFDYGYRAGSETDAYVGAYAYCLDKFEIVMRYTQAGLTIPPELLK